MSNNRGWESLVRWISLPLLLLAWEVIARSGVVNAMLFPPPSVVAVSMFEYAASGTMLIDLGWSISRIAVGFTVGAMAAIVIGVLTGGNKLVAAFFTPIFQMLRPIPPIAFVPIVIVWFGLTEFGKWFLVCWGVFFTVWLSVHLGVQRVNETLIRAAQCLGASKRAMLFEVLLPGALPYIMVGLRTAIGVSFYTLVAAELAGAFAGIAYRLEVVQQNMQIGQMMAGLIILGLTSSLADKLFGMFSARVVHWNS
ncbi:MAG: ABC transporter permease [Burkholderiales bacterium]|jgi:ABC-type nitrate/sulfonate/bicarbonate transport system permease component|nr:ABC transporter permease [Burkholderiales bacterium]MCA3161541.1 ABC transporter permease [Burkholderiales bacterium]MCA3165785.1 ABC transporter permease [Burkholderiales bacterium]MCA3171179.1 ABC transporter permease [Burkholderiales bacterium]MCA3172704.1 ABC transporter permease [Burkholderiales bacterium]